MKLNNKIEELYGPQSSGDNPFMAKARLLQSVFRVESAEAMGIGPTKNSKDKNNNPTYYGNMLCNGENTGANFFFRETFEYAQKRVDNKNKKSEETIDEYRLFNNLLSSMPMAFNLFHPLMMIKKNHPEMLNQMIRNLFPELPIDQVDEIWIELIPLPTYLYINDKSAMDAAILFSDQQKNKYLISIETKYTDSLGLNTAKDNTLKVRAAIDSGLFTPDGLAHIGKGCTQIYRNFLLTEKYRMVHQLKDSWSIVLAPKNHPTTDGEIESLLHLLKPEYQYKLRKYSLEDFVSALGKTCPVAFQDWLEQFFDRYLNFEKIESIMHEPIRL